MTCEQKTGSTFQYRSSIQRVNCYSGPLSAVLDFDLPVTLTGIASLAQLMRDFSAHYKTTPSPGFAPKAGNLVSAKFSDGAWYWAKIRRVSPVKRKAEVTFIDYGNQDTIGFKDIRPLDSKFQKLPGQAHDARLRCAACPVHLAPPTELYHSRLLILIVAVL